MEPGGIGAINDALPQSLRVFSLPCFFSMAMAIPKLPDFDELPDVQGMPKGCAWGIFDQDGKDVFGTINLVTPDIVRAALAEAKDGVSISLKCASRFMPASFPAN